MTIEDKINKINELANELSILYQEIFVDVEKEIIGYERAIDTLKVKNYDLEEKNEKQQKILDILKPYFNGAVFPSAINFNFSQEDWKPIEEWLEK